MKAKEQNKPHQALLEDRERLSLSGLTGVDSSDDRTVILYTNMGMMTVVGKQLHLAGLSLETGTAVITGDIYALRYGDRDRISPRGAVGRLLR